MSLRCSENRRTKALQSEESPNKSNTGSQQQSKLEFRNKVSQKKTFFSDYFGTNVSVVCFLMEGWMSDRVASNYSCQLDRRDEDSLVRWWRVGLCWSWNRSLDTSVVQSWPKCERVDDGSTCKMRLGESLQPHCLKCMWGLQIGSNFVGGQLCLLLVWMINGLTVRALGGLSSVWWSEVIVVTQGMLEKLQTNVCFRWFRVARKAISDVYFLKGTHPTKNELVTKWMTSNNMMFNIMRRWLEDMVQ